MKPTILEARIIGYPKTYHYHQLSSFCIAQLAKRLLKNPESGFPKQLQCIKNSEAMYSFSKFFYLQREKDYCKSYIPNIFVLPAEKGKPTAALGHLS